MGLDFLAGLAQAGGEGMKSYVASKREQDAADLRERQMKLQEGEGLTRGLEKNPDGSYKLSPWQQDVLAGKGAEGRTVSRQNDPNYIPVQQLLEMFANKRGVPSISGETATPQDSGLIQNAAPKPQGLLEQNDAAVDRLRNDTPILDVKKKGLLEIASAGGTDEQAAPPPMARQNINRPAESGNRSPFAGIALADIAKFPPEMQKRMFENMAREQAEIDQIKAHTDYYNKSGKALLMKADKPLASNTKYDQVQAERELWGVDWLDKNGKPGGVAPAPDAVKMIGEETGSLAARMNLMGQMKSLLKEATATDMINPSSQARKQLEQIKAEIIATTKNGKKYNMGAALTANEQKALEAALGGSPTSLFNWSTGGKEGILKLLDKANKQDIDGVSRYIRPRRGSINSEFKAQLYKDAMLDNVSAKKTERYKMPDGSIQEVEVDE